MIAAGCDRSTSAENSAAGADTLYIGVAASRAQTNIGYFQGVELALAHLNAARPRNAAPLGLRIPLQDQTSQVRVAAAFRDDPTVIGVVGHTGSAQTMEAAPIYGDVEHGGRNAVVAVTPTATNPLVTKSGDWVFRVCPTDLDAAGALADYIADSVRARRVAVIYRNDLFGRGFSRTLGARLNAKGVQLIERDPYLAGITTYSAYLRRIATRNVDALVVAGGGTDAADMIRALRATRARPAVLGSDDLASLASTPEIAAEFRGVRYTTFYLPGGSDSSAAAARRFEQDYRARFGQPPTPQAALSYDAAIVIGRAAMSAGRDRRRVRDAVAATGRGGTAYHGVTGTIRFDEQGDAIGKNVAIVEVRP